MEQVDITKLSITELKALAFDELFKIDMAQRNLKILQAEIEKKNAEKSTTI